MEDIVNPLLANCYVCREETPRTTICYGPFPSYIEADNYSLQLHKEKGFKKTRLTHTTCYFPNFLRRLELMYEFIPNLKIKRPETPSNDQH